MFFSYFFGFIKLKLLEINLIMFITVSSCRSSIMDFILNDAVEEENDYKLAFSGEESSSDGEYFNDEQEMYDESTTADEEFINDSIFKEEQEDESFYRNLNNREEYVNFSKQTRNPIEVVNEEEPDYFGEADMPELFDPEDREQVDFDLFDSSSDRSMEFRESLLHFSNDVKNQFFDVVIYGLMHLKLKGIDVKLENARETLGEKVFLRLKEIEKLTMLDHSLFVFFNQCQKLNDALSEHGYFLRFYERRNKFRYQVRKKLKEKNEVRKELSACVIQKFNGYELLRNYLNSDEKQNYIPIDIVYEPTLDDEKPIACFFAPDVSLAFNCKIKKSRRGKRELLTKIAR